jgi:terminase small subunit / prophage DNA-packing protein
VTPARGIEQIFARGERIGARQYAELIGVSVRTVAHLAKEIGAPYTRDGWEMPEAVAWYARRELARGKATARTSAGDSDSAETRLRAERAAAELAELKLARERDELMTVEQFDRVLSDAFSRVAARLDNLPVRLAAVCVGVRTKAEALALIEPLVDEARSELYASGDLLAEDAA